MPRRAGPWFRKARGGWMATINGKQHNLGVSDQLDKQTAQEAFDELVRRLAQLQHPAAQIQPTASKTVPEAVAQFLARSKTRVSAGTYRGYAFALETHFLPAFRDRTLGLLDGAEIEDWANRPQWSNSTRNNYLGAVQMLLKWARVPLPIRRPPKESRGPDVVLTDEQFAKVLAAYDDTYGGDLKALLRLLHETGARPQEAARLTVDGVDWSKACTRTKEHKSRRHGGERVIHFSDAAVEILETQRAKHGGGHLFRTRAGNPYCGPMIVKQMRRLSKRVGFRAIAYGERHSFATHALASGESDTLVAAALGHRGTAMVHKNYSHVAQQARAVKGVVQRVSRRATA